MADGAERRRRQITLDFEKEKATIKRQQEELAAANLEAGVTTVNENGLTEEQQAEIDRATEISNEKRAKSLRDVYQLELQQMRDYLKKYGTYQQQKLAVAEEYDRKIAESSDEWTKKDLAKEKASSLQNIEIAAIKQSVDWGSVFGSFGSMFKEQLEPTIAKLKAISTTEEFRNSDLQDQQTLYELISKLEEANASWDGNIFNTLGADLMAYQTAMLKYIDAQEKERLATEELAKANKQLKTAEAKGDDKAIASAKADVDSAATLMSEASKQVESFGMEVKNASNTLQTSTTTVNNMFSTLISSLSGLKSGSLNGVGESLMSLDKLFNHGAITNVVGSALSKGLSKLLGNTTIGKSVADALGNSGLVGSIISAILSLLDILKDGLGALVSSLIDTVLGAVSGIISHLLDGSMFVSIGTSLLDGITSIFDALSFGLFSSLFNTSNEKEVKETIDQLTQRNTDLQKAIESLTEEMKAGRGTKSVEAYREAYRLQKEYNDNYLSMAIAQAGYHDSKHSFNYYWEGFSAEQISRLSSQIGRLWDGSLWSLSPTEMAVLRDNADMWQQILDTGKGGYGEQVGNKLNDYIAQAGKLEELTTQLYEGLTGITFDTLYDSFVDQLMDMDATAEDFADNISEYFMRAMLSNKIGELYAEQLEEWWNKFGSALEDGELSEFERNHLAEEYMHFVEEAMKLRDRFAAATGYGSDSETTHQSGKSGGFTAMSQDQGTKLEGLFTSVQGHVANIDLTFENVIDKMNSAESYLAKIADNTKANAQSAEEIKEMVSKLVRDGIKTR